MDRKLVRNGFIASLAVLLGGCGSVDIVPIPPQEAAGVHRKDAPEGYIVYAPMVVVEIKADKAGGCAVGRTMVLPDYRRPYRVRVRNGFGKSGVELEFQDGWLLARAKESADNTAVLSALREAFQAQAVNCPKAGLYRVDQDSGTLERFLEYR